MVDGDVAALPQELEGDGAADAGGAAGDCCGEGEEEVCLWHFGGILCA